MELEYGVPMPFAWGRVASCDILGAVIEDQEDRVKCYAHQRNGINAGAGALESMSDGVRS